MAIHIHGEFGERADTREGCVDSHRGRQGISEGIQGMGTTASLATESHVTW